LMSSTFDRKPSTVYWPIIGVRKRVFAHNCETCATSVLFARENHTPIKMTKFSALVAPCMQCFWVSAWIVS
jgi:hypothetical protein